MPRNKSNSLTDAELRLMEVLWERGTATVSDVVNSLSDDVTLAYSTVLTTLRILENKGYARHVKEGRAFVYHPVIGQEHARATAVSHLLRKFFQNSPELLVLNLLGNKKTDRAELKRLKALIEKENQ